MRLDALVPPRQTPRARVAQLPTRVLAVQRMVELHGLSLDSADELEAELHQRAPTTRDYLHGLRVLEHELGAPPPRSARARATQALEQDLSVLTRGTPAGAYLDRVAREAAERASVLRESTASRPRPDLRRFPPRSRRPSGGAAPCFRSGS